MKTFYERRTACPNEITEQRFGNEWIRHFFVPEGHSGQSKYPMIRCAWSDLDIRIFTHTRAARLLLAKIKQERC